MTNASGAKKGARSARRIDTLVDRTPASGGSLGGDKKAGLVTVGPSWPRAGGRGSANAGVGLGFNANLRGGMLRRAPNGCCVQTSDFFRRMTTLRPTHVRGNRAVRASLLG